MSKPLELLHENIENILKIIPAYEQDLEGYEENLHLKGKNIIVANAEQPSWFVYYDTRRAELKNALEYMELYVQKIRGKLWKEYTENYSRDLQAKDKEQYINNEKAFLDAYELYLELKDLYDKYVSVVEGFKNQGYVLTNISRIITSEMKDYIID